MKKRRQRQEAVSNLPTATASCQLNSLLIPVNKFYKILPAKFIIHPSFFCKPTLTLYSPPPFGGPLPMPYLLILRDD